ncbi:YlbD family protein [Bacillus massilinigeriensis]|uniref:YlbD family protein n=1 Tax=Bacillus mediterraneensis TaxID=1805474 RepID=UPI0008F8F372|nr:YlbD family protein [Bacillus mediterraneensis]
MNKKKELHPSVQKFKEFVASNPHIIKEVRSGKATWQGIYEEWYLLGEEDARWREEKNNQENSSKDEKKDFMGQIMGMLKNLDPNQVQGQIQSLSEAIGAVQAVLSQFQGKGSAPGQPKNSQHHPFSFRKD